MIQITHLGRRAETNTQHWLPGDRPLGGARDRSPLDPPGDGPPRHRPRGRRPSAPPPGVPRRAGSTAWRPWPTATWSDSFFSPATNRRSDGFGGSLENRCRFALMVLEEIRKRPGERAFPGRPAHEHRRERRRRLGFRRESLAIARHLQERHGLLDFLNVNYGRIDTELALANECMPGMAVPGAPWLEKRRCLQAGGRPAGLPRRQDRRHRDRPLRDPRGLARHGGNDPGAHRRPSDRQQDRPGRGASYSPLRRRLPLHGRAPPHLPAQSRPPAASASGPRPSRAPATVPRRKVVVVGGGPAGLEAARVSPPNAATRWCSSRPPANWAASCAWPRKASWRRDIVGIIDWREKELEHLAVELRLNSYAEAADILAEVTGRGDPGDRRPAPPGLAGRRRRSAPAAGTPWAARRTAGGRASSSTTAPAATAPPPLPSRPSAPARMSDYVMLDDLPAKELGLRRAGDLEEAPGRGSHRASGRIQPDQGRERAGNKLRASFAHELTGEALELEGDSVVVEAGHHPGRRALSRTARPGRQ